MDKKIISYIITLASFLVLGHLFIAVSEDSQITFASGLAILPAGLLYSIFSFVNYKELRKKAYAGLLLHVATYLLVNISFFIHASTIASFEGGLVSLEEGWYGPVVNMPLFWGIGLLAHTIYTWSRRGFEDICLD